MDYHIQSIIFKKSIYSKKKAIQFLKSNGYRYSKCDETDNFYRFRQLDPNQLKEFGFNKVRTKEISNGIAFIIYYN